MPFKRPKNAQITDKKPSPTGQKAVSPLTAPGTRIKPVQIDLTHGPDLSDAALDQFADVTPADVNAATAQWNSKTSLPGLLGAKVEEEQK